MIKLFASHRPKPARIAQKKKETAPAARPDPTSGAPVPPASGSVPFGPGAKKEIGGPSGPEPTRYGDWERNGICVDF